MAGRYYAFVSTQTPVTPERGDFIREIVAADVRDGTHTTIVTRFPPEPNGYLHIGHAKSICLNFGIAREFGGRCNLRFDDTNPQKEEQEYIDAIEADVRWLGFDWGEHLHHASDYFDQLYAWAVALIEAGKAYVDDLTADEIREHRGTLTQPGRNSPWRDRPIEESLDLFERMRAGEFPNGARVLRARIDMAAPNINLRDPVLYRIVHAAHPRTGDAWCIYPTYDFAHGQSDAIEGVTHSICTLEFEVHRPLYDWLIDNLPVPSRPHQYEFARLNLTYTVLSKRVLLRLVTEGHVRGWDDPRMPTISGLRRRGFPAEGIREFATMIGVAKADSVVEVGQLEFAVRGVLNRTAQRRFAVLDPLRVVIENYPGGQVEDMPMANNPEDPSAGSRSVPFTGELWIERDDFMEDPPTRFFRLAPGREVRLRGAYFITCREVVKDAVGRGRRAALHLRPGDARRRFARRATAEGHPPLGVGPARDPRRGPAVRPPLHPPRSRGGRRPLRGPESRVGDRAHRLPRGAGPCRDGRRRDRAVRAPGLLLSRSRFRARPPRLQPHADAQGHVGEAPGAGPAGRLTERRRGERRGAGPAPTGVQSASRRRCPRARGRLLAGEWPNGKAPDSGSGD